MRLASQLTGWDIDILTEAERAERRTEEFRTRSRMFIDALDVDEVIAHLLVTEGFTSVEEVAYRDPGRARRDRGLRRRDRGGAADSARALPGPARPAITRRRRELGVTDELAALDGLTPGILVALGEKGVKTLDDLADLASDELLELLGASDKGGIGTSPRRPTP